MLGSVGDGGAIVDVVIVDVVVAGIVTATDELIALVEEVTGADEVVELVGPCTQM